MNGTNVKVEIQGMDTSKLPKLSQSEQMEMLKKIKEGHVEYKDEFVNANLRLVLSLVKKFNGQGSLENMPTIPIENTNLSILDAIILAGIAPSKGQARTLVKQGGISINDKKITDINFIISDELFLDGYVLLKKGKKIFYKLEKLK